MHSSVKKKREEKNRKISPQQGTLDKWIIKQQGPTKQFTHTSNIGEANERTHQLDIAAATAQVDSDLARQKQNNKPLKNKYPWMEKYISKRDKAIIKDLAKKFEHIFERTQLRLEKSLKLNYITDKDGKERVSKYDNPDYDKYEALIEIYTSAMGSDNFENNLLTIVAAPFRFTIKTIEKIYDKIQIIFDYKSNYLQSLFYLSPIYILERPFTFIKASERYITFAQACEITEALDLDYVKRDVFRAYLYQITGVYIKEYYTPYIRKKELKTIYSNGIEEEKKKQYTIHKLPNWCNYSKADKRLLKEIVASECEIVSFNNEERIVLNYIYKMESQSNEILAEYKDLSEMGVRENDASILADCDTLIKNYEEEQQGEFHFTSGQKLAIKQCMEESFSVVLGLPGTGKTEIVKCIMKIYKDNYNKRGEECIVSLTAPTGAAIKNLISRCNGVLNDSSRKLYGTMHKLCYGVYMKLRNPKSEVRETSFYPDLIIVDEISMADMEIFYKLLIHIKYFTSENEAPKVILLGDDNQLPSVGYGNVLLNIINSKLFPYLQLTEIMRNSGGIAKAILKMNDGKYRIIRKDFNETDFIFKDLEKYKDLRKELFEDSKNMRKLLNNIGYNVKRDRIIVAQNSTKHEKLNPWLQQEYLLKNLSPEEMNIRQIYQHSFKAKNGQPMDIIYYDDDRIVRKKNITTSQGLYLTNGDTGNIFNLTKKNFQMCLQKSRTLRNCIKSTITTIDIKGEEEYTVPVIVKMTGGNLDKNGEEQDIVLNFSKEYASNKYIGIILYDTTEFELVREIDIKQEIDLAYCTTVHKAQGGEFDNVIIWLECWMWWAKELREKKKLFYTSVSRAKKKCVIIGKYFNIQNVQENRKINRISWFLSESWINKTYEWK